MVDRGPVGIGTAIDEEERLMNEIGVVGLGVVGGALKEALEAKGIEVAGYDPYLGVGAPERLSGCSIVFLCVPTPSAPGGEFDATAVWKAVRDIEADLADGTIVAVKSTVPPGTSDALALDFPQLEFASVPEFLVSTRPLESLTKPDRILIGARTARVADAIAETMRGIAPGAPVLVLTPIEAELAKLFANAMLAAKVSMANELALICERFGVAWANVQPAVGMDRRIGPDHLTVTPERGFGGGCFPKDLAGLIAAAGQAGYDAKLLREVSAFNDRVRADVSDSAER
jgi:UDPglucose 6-dehydrogenase